MSVSKSYTFSPTTTIDSSQVNQNFDNLVDYINNTACATGMVTMWAGAIGSIPTGWQLCNGSSGAPDLRDKFIIGAGNTYSISNTGGSATHTLTEAELPSHSHGAGTLKGQVKQTSNGGYGDTATMADSNTGTSAGQTISGSTATAGSGDANNNMIPYYALAFLYKT